MKLQKILLLCVLILAFIEMDFSEAARGGRSGSRGSSSSRSRGTSRNSGSSRSRSSGGSNTVYKTPKYTAIPATNKRSPVIVTQTTKGLRTNTFTKVFVGYMVVRYTLGNAKVYRYGYPMYRSYVTIPKDRAVRLTSEESKLMDADGNLCVNETKMQNLREGIDEYLLELNTTIMYKKTGDVLRRTGINQTVSLKDIKDEDFVLMSNARYNITIVNGTNCTQLEKKVEGTMVIMYQTNPNTAGTVYISCKLLLAGIALLRFLNM